MSLPRAHGVCWQFVTNERITRSLGVWLAGVDSTLVPSTLSGTDVFRFSWQEIEHVWSRPVWSLLALRKWWTFTGNPGCNKSRTPEYEINHIPKFRHLRIIKKRTLDNLWQACLHDCAIMSWSICINKESASTWQTLSDHHGLAHSRHLWCCWGWLPAWIWSQLGASHSDLRRNTHAKPLGIYSQELNSLDDWWHVSLPLSYCFISTCLCISFQLLQYDNQHVQFW